MELTHLALSGYRNLSALELDFPPGITVLWGENAQGKTNLLESVYLCCLGRSHRSAREQQNLIASGRDTAYISARVRQKDGIHSVEIVLSHPSRKTIRVNGSPIRRMSEMMGHATAVIFSPEDLQLIREGPSARRRFMDSTLSQIYPSYCQNLQQYQRALAQRNDLLRGIMRGLAKPDTLFVWDEELAGLGARLITARRKFLDEIAPIVKEIHRSLTNGRESFLLEYAPSITGDSEDALRAALLDHLEQGRERDLRLQSTQTGPHRDDLSVILDDKSAREQASQGQVRTCAIAMKLSQLHWMKGQTGEMPILLLDDVYSELDLSRRKLLQSAIEGAQTILTCTDIDTAVLPKGISSQVLQIHDGRIST